MIDGLPYDAEVEYLESTGTQYIDTGLPISQGYRFVSNVAFVGKATTSASRGNFLWYVQSGFNTFQCSENLITPLLSSQMPTIDTSGNVFYEIEQRAFAGDKSAAVDGVVYATLTSSTIVSVQNWNYLLFAGVTAASGGRILKYGYAKCRNFAMYDSNNRALIDLIPVRFTNELGQSEGAMYDRVSRKLFRNAGTGSFTIGPDVATPVMGLHFMKLPKKTAKNYVQDGLIAMWDGIENAGWGVHDPNATVWKDLSGTENDLTLWPDGRETWEPQALANASSTADTPCFATMNHDPRQFATIEVVFRNDAVTLTRDVIRPFEVPDSEWHGFLVYPSKLSVGYGSSGAMNYLPITGDIVSASATFASATSQIIDDARINGSGVSLTSNWSRTKYDRFVVGGRIAPGAPFIGAIYCIRLYSRALTTAEIAANYAVDKERFNLP